MRTCRSTKTPGAILHVFAGEDGPKGEALETLHQVHALALAYAQLLSMSRINVLQRLKDVHAARRQQHAAMANPPTPDPSIVQQLFEPGQPDTLQFNW